jgi:hypothetical protein
LVSSQRNVNQTVGLVFASDSGYLAIYTQTKAKPFLLQHTTLQLKYIKSTMTHLDHGHYPKDFQRPSQMEKMQLMQKRIK